MLAGPGSEKFVSMFEYVRWRLSEPLSLMHATRFQVKAQIEYDIKAIAATIRARTGKLTPSQCALIGDLLHERVAKDLPAVQELIEEYHGSFGALKQFGSNLIPTQRLSILRAYDRVNSTSFGSFYLVFLCKISEELLKLGHVKEEDAAAILAEFELYWKQAVTGIAEDGDKESGRALAEFLNESLPRLWFVSMRNLHLAVRFKWLSEREKSVENKLHELIIDIGRIEFDRNQHVVELITQIGPSIGLYGSRATRTELVRELLSNKNGPFLSCIQSPPLVEFMEAIEEGTKGRELSRLAAGVYARLTDVLISTNDRREPSAKELKWKDSFKTALEKSGYSSIHKPAENSLLDDGADFEDAIIEKEVSSLVAKRVSVAKPVPAKEQAVVENRQSELDLALLDLGKLIGLKEPKEQVQRLTNLLRLQQTRTRKGLPNVTVAQHLVFAGNPGTGKTTVARLVGRIYRALGILPRGHVVEADRGSLVGAYVGHTAIKVKEVVKEARGGILFIDEAYSLIQDQGDSYGNEALTTLLKLMEDERDKFVVIAAGYPEEMRTFVNSNPGLSSRFGKTLDFGDYNAAELEQIFLALCASNAYQLSEAGLKKLRELTVEMYQQRDKFFGNARSMRTLFHHAVEQQAQRLATVYESGSITEHLESQPNLLIEILDVDLEQSGKGENREQKNFKVGF
jgi:SpoVK/Ycf46/Vps4 family AAA+-type ATPase